MTETPTTFESSKTPSDKQPTVLIFDSGAGGVATLRLLLEQYPTLSYVYVADNAFFPYGVKTASVIRPRVHAIIETICERYAPKIAVIACNTASSAAYDSLCALGKPFPFIEPIQTTCRAIKTHFGANTDTGVDRDMLCVVGTRLTVALGQYEKALAEQFRVFQCPAPELVRAVEEGYAMDTPQMSLPLDAILLWLDVLKPKGVILGCTHYSWVKSAFEARANVMKTFDSATLLAESVAPLIEQSPELLHGPQVIYNTAPSVSFNETLKRAGISTAVDFLAVPQTV